MKSETGQVALRLRWGGGVLVTLLCLALASPAWCGTIGRELLEKLAAGQPGKRYPVIVKMVEQEPGAGALAAGGGLEPVAAGARAESRRARRSRVAAALRQRAEASQQELRRRLKEREREGKVQGVTPFWIFNGLALTATAEAIREIAQQPEVDEVEADRVLAMAQPAQAAAVTAGWNLDRINLTPLWERGLQGAGTVVATLDSGVDGGQSGLMARWRGGSGGWFDPYDGSSTPFDENGHGTGVLGVIAGGSANGIQLGVAPQATWIAAKVFHNALNPATGRMESVAEVSKIHAGFQWLLGLGAAAPDVVNGSWDLDSPGTVDPVFQDDVTQLKNAGIEVVFAAGNSGPNANTSVSPANYPGSLAVGASDQLDQVAPYSGRGPSAYDGSSIYPSLVAPGDGIRTFGLTYNGQIPDATQVLSGTSFAAPHVAGVYALLKSALPDATPQQIEAALEGSIAGQLPDNSSGYGRLDAGKAYAYLALPGDVTGDGRVSVADAVTVLRAVVNPELAVGLTLKNGDLFPPGQPDGVLSIEDALLVLQKALAR
ncbi:MAG TPA: S8 family serine peptidase [Geomonas sp.]|nr:S8 family serine peptidase [Geomonas sp.]